MHLVFTLEPHPLAVFWLGGVRTVAQIEIIVQQYCSVASSFVIMKTLFYEQTNQFI